MKKFVSITISDSRFIDNSIPDLSGDKIIEILSNSNLVLYDKRIIPDEEDNISKTLRSDHFWNTINSFFYKFTSNF